jgi:two-component system, chemotaxis family, chemotaxis protein CheY
VKAIVIDDSRAVRILLGNILKEIGYEVSEAANGLEALSVLEETGSADLALVDWNMPEMNGFEFVRAVRADHAYDGMCLIMVTTETEKHKVVNALNEGADGYVVKPFNKSAIVEKLSVLGVEVS